MPRLSMMNTPRLRLLEKVLFSNEIHHVLIGSVSHVFPFNVGACLHDCFYNSISLKCVIVFLLEFYAV